MAVVAGGTVPQKVAVVATAVAVPGAVKALQPDSPSAVVPAPALVEVPLPALVEVPAEDVVPVSMPGIVADDGIVTQQDSPSMVTSTAADDPSQQDSCRVAAEAGPEEMAVTSHDASAAERAQTSVLQIHERRPAAGNLAAGEATSFSSASADATAAATVHEEGPARDSSPILGIVDSISGQFSAADAATASIVQPTLSESCSTVQ